MAGGLPDDVRSLIAQHIGSVLELDVLLAMRTETGTSPAAGVARELRLNEEATAEALEKFTAAGFLKREGTGYRFEPRTAGLSRAVNSLAEAYARRRVTVIGFIYSGPSESVSAFADAFKLRKED